MIQSIIQPIHISLASIILTVALGFFALWALSRIAKLTPGTERRRQYIRLVPIGQLLVICGVLIAIARIVLTNMPGYFYAVLVAISLVLLWASRHFLRDVISGVLLRAESPFLVGERLFIDNAEGTIESVGVRSVSVRKPDGVISRIPYLSLSQSALSRPAASGQIHSKSFRIEIEPTDAIQATVRQISTDILRLPWTLPAHPPIVETIEATEKRCEIRITIFTIDPSFFAEIEKRIIAHPQTG